MAGFNNGNLNSLQQQIQNLQQQWVNIGRDLRRVSNYPLFLL